VARAQKAEDDIVAKDTEKKIEDVDECHGNTIDFRDEIT
jgi:hypothetical protein